MKFYGNTYVYVIAFDDVECTTKVLTNRQGGLNFSNLLDIVVDGARTMSRKLLKYDPVCSEKCSANPYHLGVSRLQTAREEAYKFGGDISWKSRTRCERCISQSGHAV